MKNVVDFTNKIKEYFASKTALSDEAATRTTIGAHNFAPITNVTQEINGVTFTAGDTVKVSGTLISGSYVSFRITEKHPIDVSLKGKECKLHYDNSKGGMLYMWIEGYDSSNTKVLDKTINYTSLDTTFTIPSSTETITIAITVLNTYDGALFDVQPMLILASDPSPAVFTPYAKSNRDLTEAVEYAEQSVSNNGLTAYFYKYGKVAFVTVLGSLTNNVSNGDTLFTIPTGYIPVNDCNVLFANPSELTDSRAILNTSDGTLSTGANISSGSNVRFSCTYICK